MNFEELIKTRYSVRDYQNKKIDRTTIQQIINAGRVAPSAANKQPVHFVAIDDEVLIQKMHNAYKRDWFKTTPCIIVIYGNHDTSWTRSSDGKDHCDIDAAIAIDHITLMAAELGLGTCWICNFDADIVNQLITKTKNMEPIALLSLGYPAQSSIPEKKRKDLNDILSFNQF